MKFKNKKTGEIREFDYTQINSSLVSAQNRVRNYRVGKLQEDGTYAKVEIPQPEDKGILLKDILEPNAPDKYNLTERGMKMLTRNFGSKGQALNFDPSVLFKITYPSVCEQQEGLDRKCPTLTASMGTGGGNVPCVVVPKEGEKLIDVVDGEVRVKQATKQGYIVAEEGDGISLSYPSSTTRRGRVVKGKSNTLTACGQDSWVYEPSIQTPCGTQLGKSQNFGTSFGSQKAYTLRASNPNGVIESIQPPRIRKLTPIECERLQTLKDGYTEGVSDSQRYKMLGNGWTCDVIAHIFSFLPKE